MKQAGGSFATFLCALVAVDANFPYARKAFSLFWLLSKFHCCSSEIDIGCVCAASRSLCQTIYTPNSCKFQLQTPGSTSVAVGCTSFSCWTNCHGMTHFCQHFVAIAVNVHVLLANSYAVLSLVSTTSNLIWNRNATQNSQQLPHIIVFLEGACPWSSYGIILWTK